MKSRVVSVPWSEDAYPTDAVIAARGLTPDDVYRLYAAKLGINHKRQDEGRSQAEHGEHEDENRGVV